MSEGCLEPVVDAQPDSANAVAQHKTASLMAAPVFRLDKLKGERDIFMARGTR